MFSRRSAVQFLILSLLLCSPVIAQTTGDNPRFAEVGEKLDQGADLYVYLNVKDQVRHLFDAVQTFVLTLDDSKDTRKAFELGGQVLESLGVFNVEDIGFSSARIGDTYRSRSYVRIPGERKGLFKVLGGAPHSLDLLGQVPADTVIFRGFDLDVSALYELAREVIVKVGGPEGLAEFDQVLKAIGEPLGTDVPAIIQSFSGKWGLFLVLDESTQFTVPDYQPPITFPQPKLGIVIGVKDDMVYKILGNILNNPEEEKDLPGGGKARIRDIPVPPQDFMPVSPKLAFDGKQLILVTHADLLDYPLGLAAGKPTLADNENFKRLMAVLPQEGNDTAYVSPRLYTTLQTVLKGFGPDLNIDDPVNPNEFIKMLEGSPIETGVVAVRVNEQGGLYVAASSPSDLGLSSIIDSWSKMGSILSDEKEKAEKAEAEESQDKSTAKDAVAPATSENK